MEAISTRVRMDQNENRATSLFMGRRGQVSLGQSCRKVAQSSKGLILGYWKGRLSGMGQDSLDPSLSYGKGFKRGPRALLESFAKEVSLRLVDSCLSKSHLLTMVSW